MHFEHQYKRLTLITQFVIIPDVIRSFADRETEKLFQREFSRRFPPDIQHRARIKLEMLDAAERLEDLQQPPSNHLEALLGDRQGQHSIRVNRQWRLCFIWKEGNAHAVELVNPGVNKAIVILPIS